MPFLNELVSEADVQEQRLDELRAHYSSWSWRDGRPPGFVHDWTVDRSRGIYLLFVKWIEEAGPSGRPEPTRSSIWILDVGGSRIRIVLEKTERSSGSFRESPFLVEWKLRETSIPRECQLEQAALIGVLKEALAVYGYRGALRQIENTVVQFAF